MKSQKLYMYKDGTTTVKKQGRLRDDPHGKTRKAQFQENLNQWMTKRLVHRLQ